MKGIMKLWTADKRAVLALLSSMAVNAVYTAVNATVLAILGQLFDDVVRNGVLLVVLCIINTVLGALHPWLLHYASARNFGYTIDRYTKAIVSTNYDVYNRYTSSYVATIREYAGNVTTAGQNVSSIVSNVISLAVNIVALALLDNINLAVIITAIYAMGFFIIKAIMAKMAKNDKLNSKAVKRRNQIIDDAVMAFSEIRVFNRQKEYLDLETKENGKIYKLGIRRQRLKTYMSVIFNALDTLGLVVVIIYAVMGIQSGTITPTVALTLIMYVWRLGEPIFKLLNLSESYLTILTRAKEFVRFLEDLEDHQEEDGSLELSSFNDSIELRNVGFSYGETDNVLDSINLRIHKGMRVGIVGRSGGGKSTLFKLLNRFYRPQVGSILIDGIDLNMLTEKSLRQHISTVSQEVTILPGTIAENIRFGSKATELDVIEACKKADLMTLIESLPDGFQTQVGSRGLKLSGGQKQRIALARAFLRKSSILLLDEATSALDNNSETSVQDALASLDKETTIVTIAHRLSTVRDCDLIVVIDNHRIAEVGTHSQLMDQKGIYFSMQK